MSWFIAAIIGAIVGWLSIYAMSPDRRMNVLVNILVGAIGGIFGVWLFFIVLGLFTTSVAANFWLGVLWSVIGSLILTSIVSAIAASMGGRRHEYRETSRGVPHEYEETEVRKTKRDRDRKDDDNNY